jgi:hypothetical protein
MDNQQSEHNRQIGEESRNAEVAFGGADAVNDTPGIARHGTTPGSPFRVVAPTERSGGGNKLVWLAVIVAVGLILAYAAGMLR